MPTPDKAITSKLLRWYASAKRDLPWRHTSDPYAILVSELMCQQTQIKTVLPFYAKFMKLFPTAKALAKASEQQVLAAWAGLGYYRRARFLHAAAQAVTEQGKFPDTLEDIRNLPGVGEYTAAAVGSISFGLPAAVVDGNVIRVMSRLTALDLDASKGDGAKKIRETAQALLDPKRPGDFNQAVMELGALICSPTKPSCTECPLKQHCAAFLAGKPEAYPKLPARAASTSIYKTVLMVTRGSGAKLQVLAKQRSGAKPAGKGQAADRLKGFWAFPELELPGEDWSVAEILSLAEAKKLLGKKVTLSGRLAKIRHGITVYDIHILPFRFESKDADPKGGWEWLSLIKLKKLPLAAAETRLIAALEGLLKPAKAEDSQGQLGLKL
jgi:A/G-specific adenine glycosylase